MESIENTLERVAQQERDWALQSAAAAVQQSYDAAWECASDALYGE